MTKKRKLDVVIFSDVHLGTFGCHAAELNKYLKSIDPNIVIVNGDWLDIWNFTANYWPPEHTENLYTGVGKKRHTCILHHRQSR